MTAIILSLFSKGTLYMVAFIAGLVLGYFLRRSSPSRDYDPMDQIQ